MFKNEAGIQWQRWPKKEWLVKLLANRQAVELLLEFLKNTKVENREGVADKEEKWEQKKNQEGEDILEEF